MSRFRLMLVTPIVTLALLHVACSGVFADAPTIASDLIVTDTIVCQSSNESVLAVSHAAGWEEYKLQGCKLIPIVRSNVVGLEVRGDDIAEVAAFSADKGVWSQYKISKPIKGTISPHVNDNLVVYVLSEGVAVFHGPTASWSLLKGATKFEFQSGWVISRDEKGLAVFDPVAAKWKSQ
jgi:hypothetical protein